MIALPVGGDAHIAPLQSLNTFQRADVGIGPYGYP